MIINHDNARYRAKWINSGVHKWNGAFFYSKEICKYIIPNVKTNRNWVTVNNGKAYDHSIVFIHNNLHPARYDYLKEYKDLVLVCGVKETCDKVKHLGKTIYLPLSVDVEHVEKFKTRKTKQVAFVGRPSKLGKFKLPKYADVLSGLPRNTMLQEMAKYKQLYAVGRLAIEGMILDCEILPYDPRFPDVDIWKVLDSKDAAKILQKELDKIDNPKETKEDKPKKKKGTRKRKGTKKKESKVNEQRND